MHCRMDYLVGFDCGLTQDGVLRGWVIHLYENDILFLQVLLTLIEEHREVDVLECVDCASSKFDQGEVQFLEFFLATAHALKSI